MVRVSEWHRLLGSSLSFYASFFLPLRSQLPESDVAVIRTPLFEPVGPLSLALVLYFIMR